MQNLLFHARSGQGYFPDETWGGISRALMAAVDSAAADEHWPTGHAWRLKMKLLQPYLHNKDFRSMDGPTCRELARCAYRYLEHHTTGWTDPQFGTQVSDEALSRIAAFLASSRGFRVRRLPAPV